MSWWTSFKEPTRCCGRLSLSRGVKVLGMWMSVASGFSFLILFINAAFAIGCLILYILPAVFWLLLEKDNTINTRVNLYMSY